MTDLEGRFEQLERRVEQLETLLRQLLARTPGVPRVEFAPERPRVQAVAAEEHQLEPTEPASPRPRPQPSAPEPTAPPTVTPSFEELREEPALDLEEWIGKRGLLIVGIIALLATGVFFLEYAIQHQWIPPLVRSLASIAAGVGVSVWGHRLITQGMRKYGGPVMGAGGGLIYLGVWAAAGPFELVDRRVGIITLAVVATVFAILAQRYEIEGLAISALLGAFAAPLVLRTPTPNPELFLGYTEMIGIGGGLVAYAMEWRRTMIIAAAGYMVLAALVLSLRDSAALVRPMGLTFLVAGALLGSQVSRRKPWWEIRVVTVLGAWSLLTGGMPSDAPDLVRWGAIAAMTIICGALFVHLRETEAFQEDRESLLSDSALYLLTPVVLTGFVLDHAPILLDGSHAVVPVLVSVPYLLDGWTSSRGHALVAGIGLLAWAVVLQFSPAGVVIGWGLLAVVAAAVAAERFAGQTAWVRGATLALYASAGIALFTVALQDRVDRAPAFRDAWALTLYALLTAGIAAIWCWRKYIDKVARDRKVIWGMVCGMLLAGVSLNILQFFLFRPNSELAGNLALSVWWLSFAAALVAIGFKRDDKAVRSAGLLVAVVATGKVLLYDLSNLEALYRIGAFFVLAVIALGVAYAYHKNKNVEVSRRGNTSR